MNNPNNSQTLEAPKKYPLPNHAVLDILRMIFMISIVYCHTKANGCTFFCEVYGTWAYYPSLALTLFTKIGTSAFFIISGMLLLSKEESIEKIYKRRVWRFFWVIIIFFALQGVAADIVGHDKFTLQVFRDYLFIRQPDLTNTYWFLLTFFGLQCMLPILKVMAQNMKQAHFNLLLALHIFIAFLMPAMAILLYDSPVTINENLDFPLAHSSRDAIFFFLIGFGLEYVWPRPTKKTLLLLILSAFLTLFISGALLTYTKSITGKWPDFTTYYYMGTAMPTIALYCTCRYWVTNNNYLSGVGSKDRRIVKTLAWCGSRIFPVMLLENVFRYILRPVYSLNEYGIPLIFCSLLISILAVVMGIMIGGVTKKIPYLRRLL